MFIRLQLARSRLIKSVFLVGLRNLVGLREMPGVLWRISCSTMDVLGSKLAFAMGNSVAECYLVHTTCKYKIIHILCVRRPEKKTNHKEGETKGKRKCKALSHPSESLSLASDGLSQSLAIGECSLGSLYSVLGCGWDDLRWVKGTVPAK